MFGDPIVEVLRLAQNTFPIPAKYRYHLVMSTEIFIKLWSTETVDFPYYNIDNIIHYREGGGVICLSFTTMKACNEVQIKALEYVLRDKTGSIPILRSEDKKKQIKTK